MGVRPQAAGGQHRNRCMQTSPQALPAAELEGLLGGPGFTAFLEAVRPRLEGALLQNSLSDILASDVDALCSKDEDADALLAAATAKGGGRGAARDGSSVAGGAAAQQQQQHGGLTEAQSFTDLAYSKNKVFVCLFVCVCVCVVVTADTLHVLSRLACTPADGSASAERQTPSLW